MKTLAVLLLAAMPLFADVIVPGEERKPRPQPPPAPTDTVTSTTTSAPPTDATPVAPAQTVTRARPFAWLTVVGVAMILLIVARRRAAARVQ